MEPTANPAYTFDPLTGLVYFKGELVIPKGNAWVYPEEGVTPEQIHNLPGYREAYQAVTKQSLPEARRVAPVPTPLARIVQLATTPREPTNELSESEEEEPRPQDENKEPEPARQPDEDEP